MVRYEAYSNELNALYARDDSIAVCYGSWTLHDGNYGHDGCDGALFADDVGNDAAVYGSDVHTGLHDVSRDDASADYDVLCRNLYDVVLADE